MSVNSLISTEPGHMYCMHARIQNILSEGVVREDRNATKMDHHWPISETPLKWHFAGVSIMAHHGSFVIFRGSRSILLGNPIHVFL